jgi:hypothetical protein
VFFINTCKTCSANSESSWLKPFALQKFEALYIELQIHKKIKIPKILGFHSLKAHQIGGGMCKRIKKLNF